MARLLRFALGVMLALWLMDELAYRLIHYSPSFVDPDFGLVHGPGEIVHAREGFGHSHWLEEGVRDNGNGEVAGRGPRVLVVGDSQTEALQVDDRQTFVSLAERDLRQQGWPVQLLNCGYASRSVADFVRLAPAFRRRFHPDWVVLLVHEVDFGLDSWQPGQVHFESAANGRLRLAALPGPPVPRPRRSQTRPRRGQPTLDWLEVRRATLAEHWRAEPQLFWAGRAVPEEPAPTYPLGAAAQLLLDAYGPRVTILWRRTFPGKAAVRPPTPGQVEIEAVCRRNGVRLVDLGLESAELVRLGRAPYGFPNTSWNAGHFNATGHAWIGRVLERELLELHRRGIL